LSFTSSAVVGVPVMHVLSRILVIAEDRAARRALQRLLGSDGYDVAVTANEAVGLELLRNAPPVAVHCRPNWTGKGTGGVENKVVDLSC